LGGISMVEALGLWKPGHIGLLAPAALGLYMLVKGPNPFRTRLGQVAAGLVRVGYMCVPYTVFTWFLHPQLSVQGLYAICDGTDFATPHASGCMTSAQAATWNHELVMVWMAGMLVVEAVVALAVWRRSRRAVRLGPGAMGSNR
jgi:hypothetical protein